MAGKTVTYTIPYVDKGKVSNIDVDIFFVCHEAKSLYNDIISKTVKVQELYQQYKANIDKISDLITTRPDGYHDKVQDAKEENEIIYDEIQHYAEDGIIDERVNLILRLLEDNGVTEKRLTNRDSWYKNIDPNIHIDFLATVIWKDLDKKKMM